VNYLAACYNAFLPTFLLAGGSNLKGDVATIALFIGFTSISIFKTTAK